MKTRILLISFLAINLNLFAQTDSINSRDVIRFKYLIKTNIIPDFERILNFIADKTTAPNEVDEIINNKTKGGKEVRLFTDEKIIVENDLKPGADTNKLFKVDMSVLNYLNGFNTSYVKSDDKNIFLTLISISELKKTSYFFYNVLFECNYQGQNSDGEKFNRFNRVAEVKVVYDEGWHLYINSIYFPHGTEMDATNNYTNIIITETDVEKIMSSYDSEEQKKAREEKNKMINLLDEGDDKFDNSDYEGALKKYREARLLNFYNKEPQEKIKKAKAAIAVQQDKKQAKLEREKHIEEMKLNVVREQSNYNFKLAKILCDSLVNDYDVQDTAIGRLNAELSQINATLTGIETAIEHGNLKEAVRNCESKIKEAKTKSNIYKAELHYRMATVYFTLDKTETNKIMESLNQAIALSGNHHQEALKLRVKMYLNTGDTKDISHAVQDATQIINNDSRNPVNYVLRAGIYEKDKISARAIEDYSKAILYKSQDKTVFLKKATLEYAAGKYYEVVKTTDEGISKTNCYGILYFYRCLAKEKLKYFQEAGEDFRNATKCGISDSDIRQVHDISSGYVTTGKNLFLESKFKQAIAELTKSILLDKNENALFYRGQAYINTGNNDSAVADLTDLIKRKPDYRDAYMQRGIAFTNMGKFKEALADFNAELAKYKDNAPALYSKGMAYYKQKNYADAVTSFLQSGTLAYTDSAYYMASLANYRVRNYPKAIEASNMAKKNGTKKYDVYYLCGRIYYDIGNYSEAIKEFEKARKLVIFDDDLVLWHALALEASKEFIQASRTYDLLNESPRYKDTALFRSAVCLVSTHEEVSYNQAVGKFVRYNVIDNNPDKSEANAWAAYAYLHTGEIDKANYCINSAKQANEQCPMLQFVMACLAVKTNKYEEALVHLEKAVPGLKWKKKEYDEDPLLKELRKNKASKDRYNQIVMKVQK